MINGFYIGADEFNSFKKIVREKYNPSKARLLEIENDVNNAYASYLVDFNNLETIAPIVINVDQINALKNCYTSRTATFEKQRGDIFAKQPDVLKAFCPYCMLNKPTTLDHYTPKNEFPEYSILLKNLIPCCFNCNNKKDEVWRLKNKRRFIHFYNDTFIQHKFLVASICLIDNDPIIKFELKRSVELSSVQYNIIKWHFDQLNLIMQYNERSNTILSTEIKSLKKSKERGLKNHELKAIIEDKALSYSEDYGKNYWKSVLFMAIATQINQLI
jgi:5-methylcytosine-specific restriction endonuclease McrA